MQKEKLLNIDLETGVMYTSIDMGCDPEFFLKEDNVICGSQDLLNDNGITCTRGKVIRDGVQAELNPNPSFCREILCSNIKECFLRLDLEMKQNNKNMNICIEQTIIVPKEKFDKLDDKSKEFGCAISHNLYNKNTKITTNPKINRTRSAGGHIHLSCKSGGALKSIQNAERMVPLLDLLVGNTCVLIDKDVSNKIRRKVYGKAGEYRLPKYGIEYRTLSNFWLNAYPLMSFVFGLARFAVQIELDSSPQKDYTKEILSRVDMKDVERAINENDFDLAYSNFNKIKDLIIRYGGDRKSDNRPLTNQNSINQFEYFITKPLSHWFKMDPLKHWTTIGDRGNRKVGWETFSKITIKAEMDKLLLSQSNKKILRVSE